MIEVGDSMKDLIAEYKESLDSLNQRLVEMESRRIHTRGENYFSLLRNIDVIKEEIDDLSRTLDWMIRQYGDDG